MVSSAAFETRRSAPLKSCDAVSQCGMAMVGMPAAHAAAMPGPESSMATLRRGIGAEPARRFKVHVRCRLAARHLVAGNDRPKQAADTYPLGRVDDPARRGGGRNRGRDVGGAQRQQQIVDARHRLAGNELSEDTAAFVVVLVAGRRRRRQPAQRLEAPLVVPFGPEPDRRAPLGDGKVDAAAPVNAPVRLVFGRFAVEHDPVEVEDHGGQLAHDDHHIRRSPSDRNPSCARRRQRGSHITRLRGSRLGPLAALRRCANGGFDGGCGRSINAQTIGQ